MSIGVLITVLTGVNYHRYIFLPFYSSLADVSSALVHFFLDVITILAHIAFVLCVTFLLGAVLVVMSAMIPPAWQFVQVKLNPDCKKPSCNGNENNKPEYYDTPL